MSRRYYRAIVALASGECRWIARTDCHVYCHAPKGRDAVYSLICPDAGRDEHQWTDAASVAAAIQGILAGATP